MPWQIDGTFLRVTNNTTADPNGDLWNKDFAASIKIIATRHDVHDQDLADGIASCLNLDGLNTMRAILKMWIGFGPGKSGTRSPTSVKQP